MADNDDFDQDDYPGEVTTSVPPTLSTEPDHRPATHVLPELMIRSAFTPEQVTKLRRDRTTCVIIQAPSAGWVEALLRGGKLLGEWKFAHSATEPSRKSSRDPAAEQAMFAMSQGGGRIIGVSQNLSYLPPAMLASADIALKISDPDDDMIRTAIKAATGRLPRSMPKDVASGLTYAEICGAIRMGSSAKACVDRLQAASQSKKTLDPILSDVPRLEDMHGYGDAMVWGKSLLADLAAWREGKIDFSVIQRTVVLASAPGLGKSTFARALAKSAGIPFVPTSVGSWFANGAGYLDSVIKQIDAVFTEAASKAPALLFLDECEGIPSRANLDRNASWWTPVVGHLLLLLDSATSAVSSKIIIIGATNYPEKLDPALTRPGRLSKIIRIGPPDENALGGILRQHLGNDLKDEDLSLIAKIGVGATGADVTGWVKGARMVARQQHRAMELQDLFMQVAPPETRSSQLVRRIAVHEASHAVVSHLVGVPVEGVTIIGRNAGEGGRMTSSASQADAMSRQDIENIASILLAGRAGEQVILGNVSAGAGGDDRSDLAQATYRLTHMRTSLGLGDHLTYRNNPTNAGQILALDPLLARAVEEDLQRAYAIAIGVVEKNVRLIEAVAAALMKHRHLSGAQFLSICKRHDRQGSQKIDGGYHG